MKTLLTTLNAKYIHTSLALRWLYVSTKDKHDIDFKEFTIKEDIPTIAKTILAQEIDVVGFSVYIWNVQHVQQLCKLLKTEKPEIKIILGGPEVSYEIDYFLDTFAIDYIISGEGEVALSKLLDAIKSNQKVHIQGISSPTHRDYRQTKCVDITYLESLESPYTLVRDKQDEKNRVLYFETSRGCPYRCQYCLSSLEKGLRFFSEEYIIKQLTKIMQSERKTVKFLDRSFNAKTSHALCILNYITNTYQPGIQFQFEINGDVLDQKIIDFMNQAPKNLFRFEIGIQSTYEPTNEIVQRYQDFERLSDVLHQLQNGKNIDLHLDLIAGLPLENKQRFAKSFDDVFAFYPKEIQLGFLKLLRGTGLRKHYKKYGYQFDQQPPYEITRNNDLSLEDINDIHIVEDMVEKYWNSGKMPRTMKQVLQVQPSIFYFFLSLGAYYQNQGYKRLHYQNDEIFAYLDEYLTSIGINYTDLLIEEYLQLSKTKPKRWWKPTLSKTEAKQAMHYLVDTYKLNQEVMFRYSIVERFDNHYLVATYKDFTVDIQIYSQ